MSDEEKTTELTFVDPRDAPRVSKLGHIMPLPARSGGGPGTPANLLPGTGRRPPPKQLAAAIRRLLDQVAVDANGYPVKNPDGSPRTRVQNVAEILVGIADGSYKPGAQQLTAIEMIGDRVEGKPKTTTEIVGDSDLPVLINIRPIASLPEERKSFELLDEPGGGEAECPTES